MLVAHTTKVGEWNMSVAHDNSWWVTHRPSESQWHIYGPYGSMEEAFEESGMPKPKTELEEVWEVAKELRGIARMAIDRLSIHENLYYGAIHARDRFDNLSYKYGKE